jgi:hypothetical protein
MLSLESQNTLESLDHIINKQCAFGVIRQEDASDGVGQSETETDHENLVHIIGQSPHYYECLEYSDSLQAYKPSLVVIPRESVRALGSTNHLNSNQLNTPFKAVPEDDAMFLGFLDAVIRDFYPYMEQVSVNDSDSDPENVESVAPLVEKIKKCIMDMSSSDLKEKEDIKELVSEISQTNQLLGYDTVVYENFTARQTPMAVLRSYKNALAGRSSPDEDKLLNFRFTFTEYCGISKYLETPSFAVLEFFILDYTIGEKISDSFFVTVGPNGMPVQKGGESASPISCIFENITETRDITKLALLCRVTTEMKCDPSQKEGTVKSMMGPLRKRFSKNFRYSSNSTAVRKPLGFGFYRMSDCVRKSNDNEATLGITLMSESYGGTGLNLFSC